MAWYDHVTRHNSIAKTIMQGTVEAGRRTATGRQMKTCYVVRAFNVRKGHKLSLLDKSMTFGTDELDTILFHNFDGSNLRC